MFGVSRFFIQKSCNIQNRRYCEINLKLTAKDDKILILTALS